MLDNGEGHRIGEGNSMQFYFQESLSPFHSSNTLELSFLLSSLSIFIAEVLLSAPVVVARPLLFFPKLRPEFV